MSIKFDKLRQNWFESGYNGMLKLPIRTELIIKGGDRHIFTHRGVSFVWINGNQDNYPFVIIPLKNYGLHIDRSLFDYSAYNLFLEYLSLLSLVNWNIQMDILHRSFENYFSNHFHELETLQPFYQRTFANWNIDKQEFKSNNDLADIENLVLSLWREGNSSENIFHSYLSFFRIFELLLFKKKKLKDNSGKNKKNKDGKDMYDNGWSYFEEWIEENKARIMDPRVAPPPLGLGDYSCFMENYKKSDKTTLGDYLRDNCRHAIAHGKLGNKKVKAPNSFKDYQEIQYARSFLKAAAYLIVHEKLSTEIVIRNGQKKY